MSKGCSGRPDPRAPLAQQALENAKARIDYAHEVLGVMREVLHFFTR